MSTNCSTACAQCTKTAKPTTPVAITDHRATIFCDLDGVVIDLLPAWLGRYNAEHGDTLSEEQITDWDIARFVKPTCGRAIFDYLHQHALYDNAHPVAGALEGVQRLRELGYRVVFATACNMHMAGRKLRWLAEHGFLELQHGTTSQDYVEIQDKGLLSGGGIALIDDYQKNLDGFRGERILFSASHNKATPFSQLQSRADDWAGVVDYFALRTLIYPILPSQHESILHG